MSDTPASTHAPDADAMTALPNLSTRAITRCTILLLIVGLAARLLRYALDFPIWGDEAMLAVNFAWLDYRQLTQGLHLTQVAPLLFVWGERTAYLWLGPDEYSLRLLPLLAGVGSLLLYWHLTRVLLPPLARLFAVGFMAAALWPVGMCNPLTPYSFALLIALTRTGSINRNSADGSSCSRSSRRSRCSVRTRPCSWPARSAWRWRGRSGANAGAPARGSQPTTSR